MHGDVASSGDTGARYNGFTVSYYPLSIRMLFVIIKETGEQEVKERAQHDLIASRILFT